MLLACPKESHVIVVKHIFCYLHDTIDLGLWYPKVSKLSSISYSNDDFTRCKIDRKSIGGTCYFIISTLVLWASKKQNFVALLTTEAEYILLPSLKEFGLAFDHVPIKCDNTSTISLYKNPI
jgi:hypothetical protein